MCPPIRLAFSLSVQLCVCSFFILLSVCPSVFPSACVCFSVKLYVFFLIHLSDCPSVFPPVRLSFYLSFYLPFLSFYCPSVCLSFCQPVCLSECLSLPLLIKPRMCLLSTRQQQLNGEGRVRLRQTHFVTRICFYCARRTLTHALTHSVTHSFLHSLSHSAYYSLIH